MPVILCLNVKSVFIYFLIKIFFKQYNQGKIFIAVSNSYKPECETVKIRP